MDDLESRLATLLRTSVPEPPRGIDPDAVVSGRRRHTARRVAAPLAAAATIVAVAVGLSVGTSGHHAASAPRTATAEPWRTWRDYHVTVSYPARWQAVTYHGAPAPTTYPLLDVVNGPIHGTDSFDGPSRVPAAGVDIRFTFVTRPGLSLTTQPGKAASIAGQPAKLYTGTCGGSGTAIEAAVIVGPTRSDPPMLSMSACLGPRTTAADRADVRRVIAGVRFPGAPATGSIRGRLVLAGAVLARPHPVPGTLTLRGPGAGAGPIPSTTRTIPRSGRFEVTDLRPGTYAVSATSPDYLLDGEPGRCDAPDVRVRAGATAVVTVDCPMK